MPLLGSIFLEGLSLRDARKIAPQCSNDRWLKHPQVALG